MKIRQRTVCHTCRIRKLGCDGKQPSCTQCAWSGKKCAGYQYDLIFVPVTSAKAAAKTPKGRRRHVAQSQRKQAAQTTQSRVNEPQPLTALQPSLLWPFADVLSLVVQNFVPANDAGPFSPGLQRPTSRVCGSWIEVLPKLAMTGLQGDIVSSAVRAFGVSILARGSRGRAPIPDALDAQHSALRSLRDGIRGLSEVNSNELSAAIMCLLVSEIILPSSRVGLPAHAAGLSQLMELRGPGFYASGSAHEIFIGSRPSLIIQSICSRKATFLARQEWRTIPFQQHPPTPLQSLMTEAASIPAILEIIDGPEAQIPDSSVAGSAVVALLDVLNRLEDWYGELQASSPYCPLFSLRGSAGETRLWFPNITTANAVTHYWGFCIICLTHLSRLGGPSATEPHAPSARKKQACICMERATQMSGWILQSAEYLTQDDMKLFGAISLALPLRVAHECLRLGGDAQNIVLERTVQRINLKGYGCIESFVSGYGGNDTIV